MLVLVSKTFQSLGHSSRHHHHHTTPLKKHKFPSLHDLHTTSSPSYRCRRILNNNKNRNNCRSMASSPSSSSASSPSSTKTQIQEPPLVKPVQHDIETVIAYHERTKHHLYRYADGPRGLDWANQPNPFRRYDGAAQVPLLHFPLSNSSSEDLHYQEGFHSFHKVSMPSRKAAISRFLYDSFSLSAWKKAGSSTWSLRVNPSSGNLHPTEAYVISDAVEGIYEKPFVAHYCPREHALEIRCEVPVDVLSEMKQGFPDGVFFVGLTSIYWREAWKYGERAYRYCNHDVGHALGAIAMAGAGLGWDSILLDGWGSYDLDCILGAFGRKTIPNDSPKKGRHPELEQEHADCLVACFPEPNGMHTISNSVVTSKTSMHAVSSRMSQTKWFGIPNRLSNDHVWWDVIDKASEVSMKPTTPLDVVTRPLPTYELEFKSIYKPLSLRHVIRKRRSAVNMDGQHVLSQDEFYQIMLKTLPSGPDEGKQSETAIPFRILPWSSEVHMAIFVHKVDGLAKGLYVLVRNSNHEQKLRQALQSDFVWVKPPKCPEQLPLYLLAESNCQRIAMQLSCFQEIAGFGCFSLGMIARFDAIKEKGAWMYPRLFWECGILGQLLYLEAHALGISATGIGCYFDDPVHEILGLKGKEFQSLYHFTIGAPVEDKRITGLPAYPVLE